MNNRVLVKRAKDPEGLFPEYWPEPGKVYEAELTPGRTHNGGSASGNREFCIVEIKDKRICLRAGEFEIIGGTND